jgi:hypothetical protein
LLLFGTFGDEGEWEVASGQSIKVACRRRILKSIRERTGRTLTPDAQPKKVKQVRIRESRKKMEIDQSTKKDISKEEVEKQISLAICSPSPGPTTSESDWLCSWLT